jgi:hypothetical protein
MQSAQLESKNIEIVNNISPDLTTYNDISLNAATTYYYRVYATNPVGNSGYSDTAYAVTFPEPPLQPGNFSAEALSGSQILLVWQDSDNESHYVLQRLGGSSNVYVTINDSIASNLTSFIDDNIESGLTYFYRLKAVNTGGESPYTDEASVSVTNASGCQWLCNGEMMYIDSGKVGIGTSNYNGEFNLFVSKGIRTERVKIDVPSENNWADFVFEPSYSLTPVSRLEQFINKNKHLPGIPKASQVVTEGVDVGEMNALLLQKIEELTLYIIEQNNRMDSLEQQLYLLKQSE